MIRSLLGRLVGVEALRTWTRQEMKGLRARIAAVEKPAEAALKKVEALQRDLDLEERRGRESREAIKAQRAEIAELASRLSRLEQVARTGQRGVSPTSQREPINLAGATAHARRAIGTASLELKPGPHVVIDNVLPDELYDRLMTALPAPVYFTGEKTKAEFRIFRDDTLAPRASLDIWEAFETQVVAGALMPALLELFGPLLSAHYTDVLGQELAEEGVRLPKRANGRIMLRRPGYVQLPHVDPKRSLLTGILYLAKPGDNEIYGTQLYDVDRPFVSPSNRTYYLEADGIRCHVAKRVLYRPNRLLAFLNSVAHGAEYPADAGPRDRYAYQFYVKPADDALVQLLQRLPAEKRDLWKGVT